ncbi:uncharacterized protein VSU04_008267 [Chlamydotis macqueenii]
MAPVRRLLLILFLLVAMRARPALAAPWRAQGAAEDAEGYPPSWMDVAPEPPEYPGGLAQVEGFPISWPSPTVAPESNPRAMPVGEDEPASWLNFGMEPPQGGVGTPGAKDQGEGGNMYLESPELLSLMLKELARGLGGYPSLCLSREARQAEVPDPRLDTPWPAQRAGSDQSLAAAMLGFSSDAALQAGAVEPQRERRASAATFGSSRAPGAATAPVLPLGLAVERDRKVLQEKGFRGGSSGSAPVPAEEAEEMQATGKPDELCQTATGASHKDDAMVYKIIAAVAGAYAILATTFLCVVLCKWRESKQ